MKLIIQRVKSAKMSVNNNFKCEINRGIVAYLGITHEDDIKDIICTGCQRRTVNCK